MSDEESKLRPTADDPWQEVGWETHRRAQMKRWAAIPFAQKLEWLENAQELSLQLKRSREEQAGKATPGDPVQKAKSSD